MVQPCCGSSLKKGTMFLAVLSMAFSIIATLVSGLFLVLNATSSFKIHHTDHTASKDDVTTSPDEDDRCISSVIPEPLMIIVVFVMAIFNLFLSIMLFIGAEQENLRICSFWYRISAVLCLIDIGLLAISVIVCAANIPDLTINSVDILRSLYGLWVVHAFVTETRQKQYEATNAEKGSLDEVNMV